jgi:hypothetical protein
MRGVAVAALIAGRVALLAPFACLAIGVILLVVLGLLRSRRPRLLTARKIDHKYV